MTGLSLRHLGKTYDNGFCAVRDFNLDIEAREFIVLAGPVGCGISTVLRMVAGLEEITEGELFLGGSLLNDVPSMDRDMAMIFKNGKLYPQMSIYDNLAFGLKLKGLSEGEIEERIADTAGLLGIEGLLGKMTEELDERERALTVLGRAIAKRPKVYLMDEPFSSFDRELRVYMRNVLKKLYENRNITLVYVTHNREDVFDFGARVALMNDGALQQIGTLEELCEHPATPYVSEFLGMATEAVCQ